MAIGHVTLPALDQGTKPTQAQVQAMVDAFQKASHTRLPILVVKKPLEIDGIPIHVASGSEPTGGAVGGRIYLFIGNLYSRGETLVTICHELFRYFLEIVVLAVQYEALGCWAGADLP